MRKSLQKKIVMGLIMQARQTSPISFSELSEAAGLTYHAKLAELVEELLDEGRLIGVNSRGYYLMQENSELKNQIARLKARRARISRRLACLRASAAQPRQHIML